MPVQCSGCRLVKFEPGGDAVLVGRDTGNNTASAISVLSPSRCTAQFRVTDNLNVRPLAPPRAVTVTHRDRDRERERDRDRDRDRDSAAIGLGLTARRLGLNCGNTPAICVWQIYSTHRHHDRHDPHYTGNKMQCRARPPTGPPCQ